MIERHFSLPLFRNAYNLIIGTGLTSILGFIFWIIATRLYDTESIGLISALLSISSLIAIFAELGLGIGLIRYLPTKHTDSNNLINTCLTISGSFSLVLIAIFLLGLPVWGIIYIPLFKNPFFSITFIVFSVIFCLLPLIFNIFLVKKVTKLIVITSVIAGILKIFFLIFFAAFINNPSGLLAAAGLSTLIAGLICMFFFIPKVQPDYRPFPKIHLGCLKQIRNYSILNYISRVLLLISPLIYPLMIINVLGPEANAYFYITWSLIAIVQVIPSSLFNSLLAESTSNNSLDSKNIKRTFSLMLILLIPIILIILIFPSEILSLFGDSYSNEGSALLKVMILSIIPWGIIYLFISIERTKNYTNNVVYVTLSAACISLGLSYLLLLTEGLIGLGLGYLIGQSIVAMIVIYLLFKK